MDWWDQQVCLGRRGSQEDEEHMDTLEREGYQVSTYM